MDDPGLQRVLGAELGFQTDNGSVPVDYYGSVVYRDNYVFILQESVVLLSVGREETLSVVSSLKERA